MKNGFPAAMIPVLCVPMVAADDDLAIAVLELLGEEWQPDPGMPGETPRSHHP